MSLLALVGDLDVVALAGGRGGSFSVNVEGLGWGATLALSLVTAWMRALLRRRSALMERAAHEVRGPLFAAGLALEGAAAGDARRMAAAELELRRAGLALDDFSLAPAGRRVPDVRTWIDAGAVAGEVVAAWRPLAARFGAALRLDAADAVTLVADRLRVQQALANLVVNAAEHGRGDVLVRVRAAGEAVRIEVSDEGAGPEPARVAAASQPRCSTGRRGHGLAVAAQVAKSHGGRLFVDRSGAPACVVLELARDGRPAPSGSLLQRVLAPLRTLSPSSSRALAEALASEPHEPVPTVPSPTAPRLERGRS